MSPSTTNTTQYTRKYFTKVDNKGNNDATKTGYRYNIHKDVPKEDNKGTAQVRRRSSGRGGDFNNVQVTHVIYSKKNKDSQFDEPSIISSENFYKKYSCQIGDNSQNKNKNDSTNKYKIPKENPDIEH